MPVVPTPREGGWRLSSSQDYPWWYSKVKANLVSMRNCPNQEITSKGFYREQKSIIFLTPKQQRETAFFECVIANLNIFLGYLYMLFHKRNWGIVWTVFTPDLQYNEMFYMQKTPTGENWSPPTPHHLMWCLSTSEASAFHLAVPAMEHSFLIVPSIEKLCCSFLQLAVVFVSEVSDVQ